MNKRTVDISEYWITIVRDTAQFGQIAVAENPEFNRLAECIFNALEDSFIHSASEYGVKRWENMLQIAPSSTDTLDDRKARILTYLNLKLPYTWRVLKQLIENIVGADKVVLEYVNDECKLVVHTDRISDEKSQVVTDLIERVVPMNLVVERYNHTMEISWRELNKYAACKTKDDLLAVNSNYMNDLTADGSWIYPLSEYGNTWQIFTSKSKVKRLYFSAPKMTDSGELCEQNDVEYVELNLPQCIRLRWAIWRCGKVTEIRVNAPNLTEALLFAENCTNLRKFEGNLPKLRDAGNMFYGCKLDAQSTIGVLNNLPSYSSGSHTICMGIHVDHQNDPAVLAALDNATAKGWTVTRQWNGTPTSGVALTDLEEIYAKVEESEYGDYTDENGNRCMLDWGHQITSPDGKTPSELGYKLFFSIYDAEKYYKLSKIEGVENE